MPLGQLAEGFFNTRHALAACQAVEALIADGVILFGIPPAKKAIALRHDVAVQLYYCTTFSRILKS
jgi:hypothetical protein